MVPRLVDNSFGDVTIDWEDAVIMSSYFSYVNLPLPYIADIILPTNVLTRLVDKVKRNYN